MNKYNDSKIYKIVDNTSDKVYIGSTCQKYISQRLQGHVKNYKRFVNGQHHFVSSYEILKNGNYDIILLENVNCETIEQLKARERYFIETTQNCVNKQIPNRTNKEYHNDNKEKYKQQSKEYYESNKDMILQRVKTYKENNKEKCLETHKSYYEKNKVVILEKMKEQSKQPYECECGSIVRCGEKARHFKSKKHINFISNK